MMLTVELFFNMYIFIYIYITDLKKSLKDTYFDISHCLICSKKNHEGYA